MGNGAYGYLLVHFVEDAAGHAEQVYLSLSEGDDPLRWRRLNNGAPVLGSPRGTTGVRDPFAVRRRDGLGFHILATDLRVWGSGDPDWEALTRHGSRDLVIWDSVDLVHWSVPRYVEVAPTTFGMAWAPTVAFDEAASAYRVFFSAKVFDEQDPEHLGESAAAVHVMTTQDFETFSAPEPYLQMRTGVIDLVAVPDGDIVHVLAKHDDDDPRSLGVFHEVRRGFDDPRPTLVATHLGSGSGEHVEGPLMFRENGRDRWFLWVDQYGTQPQGFHALVSDDPASGRWVPVPDADLQLPAQTKHGSVISLTRAEWDTLHAADQPPAQEQQRRPGDRAAATTREDETDAGRRALVVRGGWDGHQPEVATDLFVAFLREQGFEVEIEKDNEVYADAARMADVDLVLQCMTMSEISGPAVAGLRSAVEAGTGLAGWHGGIADSYRNSSDYLQLVGGQFATHPGKRPEDRAGDESDNYLRYTVSVTDEGRVHPIMAGIEDFELETEQYWVLHDDLIDVLATTTHPVQPWHPWHRPITSPAVWTRLWGAGRIFVATPGHSPDVLADPTVRTIVERGLLWASRTESA